MNSRDGRRFLVAAVMGAASLLGGCASTGDARDPLEGFNRAMFSFNEGLDKVVIKPVAQGYEAVAPLPVRTGVSNAFSNVGDLWIAINNLLQGKPAEAGSDLGRVLINSTLGILGLFDVATEMGLEKHDEDFGQTLGRWGAADGAYIVLPVLGPRTVRDTFGLALDSYVDPVWNLDHVPTRNSLVAVRVVSERASFLPADRVVREAALDKYDYVRDAYLQRRRSLIHDGHPPRERLGAGPAGAGLAASVDPARASVGLLLTQAEPARPVPVERVAVPGSARASQADLR
ncbi:MAG: hypothetical protein OHK0026_13590 [Rhodocyclaceae bacterium]